MLKLTAVVSLMLIATWSQADSRREKKEATASGDFDPGSSVWAAGISCDSCGSECASACGTRHFRSCCFNYLRRKRDPETDAKVWPQVHRELKDPRPAMETRAALQSPRYPLVVVENVPSVPEPWLSNLQNYRTNLPLRPIEDLENRVQFLYD
ncbi:hypothetical protein O0L34_g19152 [Tuta absoluta]|nr:hypothetical protein O0L34_g19152 [Tuta absoluta]